MPVFTARNASVWEILTSDQFGGTGKATVYQPSTAKVTGADRYNANTFILSGGLSAQAVTISPLGVSAPAMLILMQMDYPVDIRTNAASDTVFLSGVTQWFMTGHISNIYVTTGSYATTFHVEVAGGSNATLQASFPLP